MTNRMLFCLLSAGLMVNFNFAAQHHQSEDFVEIDINAYLRQHPKAQPAFKETVMRNGNAAWNVAMKTIAHDTLWTSGIGGIAMMATLAWIGPKEDRIKNARMGLAMGASFCLPLGLVIGTLRGGYQAHQTLQCGALTTEHNCNKQHFYTSTPYSTAINAGAPFALACGLLNSITGLKSPEFLPFQLLPCRIKHTPTGRYVEGTLTGASIATLGVAGYCLYNEYFASKPEDQRIQATEQNSEQDAEVIRTARMLARDYTRTHKISTLFSPASCTDGLY